MVEGKSKGEEEWERGRGGGRSRREETRGREVEMGNVRERESNTYHATPIAQALESQGNQWQMSIGMQQ